jgi:hypothetical protein
MDSPSALSTKNTPNITLSNSDSDSSFESFTDLVSIAKRKAREKADSIQAAMIALQRLQFVQDSTRRAQQLAAQHQQQEKRQLASDYLLAIYHYLEQGNYSEAKVFFQREKEFLLSYCDNDAIFTLNETISQLSDSVPHNTPSLLGTLSSNKQNDSETAQGEILKIYDLLEHNEIDSAFANFKKQRKKLKKHLDTEAFALLESSVMLAHKERKSK